MWGNYVKGRLEVMRGGQVLSSGERDGDMRCSGGGWDSWDGLYGRLEEGAGEIFCMNLFTAEYLDYEMPVGIWLLII